jgi:transposase
MLISKTGEEFSMSLHPCDDNAIPEETQRVAQAVFPNGNLYMQMRDIFGPIYNDELFAPLFARRGQPAESPWRLALITVMQFLENLTDRQAADAVRARIDWKYALGLSLTDAGFDYSILSEFRGRLVSGQAEQILFETLLSRLAEKGLLKTEGQRRTDSTYILGNIRKLNQLELAGETLRHVLNVLAEVAPQWLLEWLPREWRDRYGQPWSDFRLPRKAVERAALTQVIGQDGYTLLEHIISPTAPTWLAELPAIRVMHRVWLQEFYQVDDQVFCREATNSPPSGQEICSPYDPEARYGRKRDAKWIGYKVHLSETCEEGKTNLITHVETTLGSVSDVEMLAPIHQKLQDENRLPADHLVDMGYITSDTLVESWVDFRVTLVGPARANPSRQAADQSGYDIAHFTIDWEQEQVLCPQGKVSQRWRWGVGRRGKPNVLVEFDPKDCRSCPVRQQCIHGPKASQRNITLQHRNAFEALQAARQRQQNEGFRTHYAKRAGIEGTIGNAVFVLGMRRARYRGLEKVHLQHIVTATAMNLSRAVHWLVDPPRLQRPNGAFARLIA